MATPTYIDGASNVQIGIASAESGIKVSSVDQSWSNNRAITYDHVGTPDGFVVDWDKQLTMTMTGETAGSDFSDLAPNFHNRVVPSNFITTQFGHDFSGVNSGVVLSSVSISQGRAPQFQSITLNYEGWEDVVLTNAT